MLPEQLVYLGLVISLIGQIFYLRSIVLGLAKPNLVSHFIWMLAPFIGFFFQIKAGAGLSALAIFMAGFASLLVIVVSLLSKHAYWKLEKFDFICGGFSVLAIVLYVITQNLGVSILFAIIGDALAYIPTITKDWKFPETDTASIYMTGIASNFLALLTIKSWDFTIYSFSVSIILFNSVVIFCLYRKKIFPPKIISSVS